MKAPNIKRMSHLEHLARIEIESTKLYFENMNMNNTKREISAKIRSNSQKINTNYEDKRKLLQGLE